MRSGKHRNNQDSSRVSFATGGSGGGDVSDSDVYPVARCVRHSLLSSLVLSCSKLFRCSSSLSALYSLLASSRGASVTPRKNYACVKRTIHDSHDL